MNKRQTRAFFLISTLVLTVVFIVLSMDAHRQVPTLTHQDKLTPEVIAGKNVWHARNCVNCHTLLGEGAYYAPDLTKIASQRSEAYLRAFLQDPSRFYSEERDRRLMPNLNLSEAEISSLIQFLGWVDKIDTNGWPPRPILVSGESIPGSNIGAAPPSAASNDPVELGDALFHRSPPACYGCHSVSPGVNVVGPSLAHISKTAAERLRADDYKGKATDVESYIRESITDPHAYVLPGPTFSNNGRSLMPDTFSKTLTKPEIDQLVAYLMSLK